MNERLETDPTMQNSARFINKSIQFRSQISVMKFPSYINIDKFLYWLAGAICTMNNDGFTHNYALYHNNVTGLFEFIPWDYDATWGRKVDGGVMQCDYVQSKEKRKITFAICIMRVPEFRELYRNILDEILETKFTVDYMESKIRSLHEALRPHVLLDPYKKGKIDAFDKEPEFIFQFIRDRNSLFEKATC